MTIEDRELLLTRSISEHNKKVKSKLEFAKFVDIMTLVLLCVLGVYCYELYTENINLGLADKLQVQQLSELTKIITSFSEVDTTQTQQLSELTKELAIITEIDKNQTKQLLELSKELEALKLNNRCVK